MSHPYRQLSKKQFWSSAMLAPAPGHVDPVLGEFPQISKTDRIATMGSCFAQHISANLSQGGYNYYVTETSPVGINSEDSKKQNYGVFSARYGNVYTVKQALQLLQRSFGEKEFESNIWNFRNCLVDAFRPNIQPEGFKSETALIKDRIHHLKCVKDLFMNSDWFIFTLGLTEAWRSKSDHSIFPLAPGVHGGSFDPALHEFVNFTTRDVIEDLSAFVKQIQSVNKKVQIILSVSPVALMATYEKKHVLTSNTYSKAVLRVAAEEVSSSFKKVHYFPSFEIITSPANQCRYIDDDLRSIKPVGVSHVMRIFRKHFMHGGSENEEYLLSPHLGGVVNDSDVVCDEELIEKSLRNI